MLSVNVGYTAALVCLALGQLLSLSVTTEKCPARGIVYFCAKEGKYFLTCRSSKSLRHSGPCLSVLAGDRQNTQHRVEQDLKHSSAHYWSVFLYNYTSNEVTKSTEYLQLRCTTIESSHHCILPTFYV